MAEVGGQARGTAAASGKTIAALVLGIVGLVVAFFFWPLGLILSIPGLVLGEMERRSGAGAMAAIAVILSIIAIVISLLGLGIAIWAVSTGHLHTVR